MCVITAYGVQCLVAGCRGSGAGKQAMCTGRGMLHDCSHATSLFSALEILVSIQFKQCSHTYFTDAVTLWSNDVKYV